MIRRLLFFPILRTRSARKNLVGRSVIVLLLLVITSSCDERAPRREPPETPERSRWARPDAQGESDPPRGLQNELEQLEAEAGVEVATDLPAPSGDLKQEIDSFSGLDACTRAHALRDAVLGDAIDALGYDTLARDGCRVLQALHAKDAALCQPIALSPLRTRCESYVATLAGDASVCPVLDNGSKLAARDPVCLARALRDERLCAGALLVDRSTCRALVLGRVGDCGHDQACIRQVERWTSLFEKPVRHAPFPAHLHIEVTSDESNTGPVVKSVDMDDIAQGGAAVRITGDKMRISLGAPKNALWPAWDAPLATPRIFLEVSLDKAPRAAASPAIDLGAADLTLDLLLPQIAQLSALTATDRKLEIAQGTSDIGGPLKMTLTSKMHEAPRTFAVKIELETFVRDVVGRR